MCKFRNKPKLQLIHRTTEIIQVPMTPKISLHPTFHFRQLCLLHRYRYCVFNIAAKVVHIYLSIVFSDSFESVNKELIGLRDKLSINQGA